MQIVFNSFGQEDGALVEQLGDDRWSNVCAAFCHITTLVLIAFLHFFFRKNNNPVLVSQTKRSMIPPSPSPIFHLCFYSLF